MPNITITIPQPALMTGQYFKVRYRLLPSGGWSSYTNRSNAAFTLTGLSTGQYQMEVILVKADGSQCSAIYKTFTVTPEFSCISFSSVIVKTGQLYYLLITYTLPMGFTNPSCGWEIMYIQNGVTVNNVYTTLPVSGVIKIPVGNSALALFIRANMCDGRKKECHSADVSPLPVECAPMVINNQQMAKVAGKFYITLTFTQSTPPTTSLLINYNQTGTATANTLTAAISTIATTVSFQVFPTTPVNNENVYYTGAIVDRCSKQHKFSVSCFYY